MRKLMVLFIAALGVCAGVEGAIGQTTSQTTSHTSCKVCADQQAACMKNYEGPTCKSEYQMCMKSCKK
jgi:hypothetical protein